MNPGEKGEYCKHLSNKEKKKQFFGFVVGNLMGFFLLLWVQMILNFKKGEAYHVFIT